MSLTSRGQRAGPRLARHRAAGTETPAGDQAPNEDEVPAGKDEAPAGKDEVPAGKKAAATAGAADASRVQAGKKAPGTAGAADGSAAPAPRHRRARIGPLVLAGRPAVVAVGVGLLMAGSGTAGLLMSPHSHYVPPHVAKVKPVLPPVGPQQQTPAPQVAEQVSPPVSLTVPVIGVRTRIIHLGLTRSGDLQVPKTTAVAGWYTGSPRPGAVGSAVIAGHVDSYLGPGVFFRLRQLRSGDRIYVRQSDGRVAVFRVSSVHLYTHTRFPRTLVYGPTPTPTLRLITCGGTFDYQTRGYLSNVVVYAVLTS